MLVSVNLQVTLFCKNNSLLMPEKWKIPIIKLWLDILCRKGGGGTV